VQALGGPGEAAALRDGLGAAATAVHEHASVDEWAASLTALDLLITLDTGPMHLACALGVPVVALFGSTSVPLWAPPGDRAVIVTRQWQFPALPVLQVESGLAASVEAMSSLSVEDVMAGVRAASDH
jgi:ADP-heptose:LPS heptosyltransferase